MVYETKHQIYLQQNDPWTKRINATFVRIFKLKIVEHHFHVLGTSINFHERIFQKLNLQTYYGSRVTFYAPAGE